MYRDADQANTEWIEGTWEDFDQELAKGNLANCLAIKEEVGGRGFESDALRMFQLVNAAKAEQDFEYVPYKHPTPPELEVFWQEKDPSKSESEYETVADEDGQNVIKKV